MSEAAQATSGQDQGGAAAAAAAGAAAAGAAQNGAAANGAAANGAQANGAANNGAAAQANGNGAAASIASGAQQQQQQEPVEYWPKDWREKIAEHASAGDKKAYDKELKRLQNMDTPLAMHGSWRSMENTWASKKFIKLPGEDAKPEEVAEYHKALGVPEKAEDYYKALDKSIVIGDADKPVIDSFLAEAHKAGTPPSSVKAVLGWYFKQQEQQAAQLDEMDETFRREADQVLRNDFGNAFKRKVNSIAPLFSSAPGGPDVNNPKSLYSRLMGGRTADGKLIGNDPDIVRWMVSMSQEINPAASIVEDGGAGGGQSVENEIAAIEKRMREDRRGYNKDTAMQDRYRVLLDTRSKIRARA